MDGTIKVLKVANILVDNVPIPGLSAAVQIALRLAQAVKSAKDTQDGCRSLAERAVRFSAEVYCQLSKCEDEIDVAKTAEHVEDLLSVLQEIESLMNRRTRKRFIAFFQDTGKISKEVTRLKTKLDDTFRVFEVRSSIRTEQQLSLLLHTQTILVERADNAARIDHTLLDRTRDIDSNVTDILYRVKENATHDGTMRLYGRDEVELLEELERESPDDGSETDDHLPTCFRARLSESGKSVTVRRFPRADATFHAAVQTAKKIWHPNIVHAIGYSRPDPDTAFIVNGGVYTRTFNDLSKSFHGIDKFLWTMRYTKQIYAGLMYLKSIRDELGWTSDEDTYPIQADNELVISTDSRVLLDVGCYRLDRLPNTVIHDDGMVELHTRGRELIKGFRNPLDGSSTERFAALRALWHDLVSFADFSRDDSVVWPHRRIPSPGECFSCSQQLIISGLEYEELVLHQSLTPEYTEPEWCPNQRYLKARAVSDTAVECSPPGIQHKIVSQKMPAFRRLQEGDGLEGDRVIVRQHWRRYTIKDMYHGWTMETATTVRETGDCRGWFMNEAVEFCHTPEDLNDLAIAYALRFRTRTSLGIPAIASAAEKPPTTLYFYERVHDKAHASLDERLDWPWGFWSMDPHDRIDICDIRDVRRVRQRKHRIAYLGVSRDREFIWSQMIGPWSFQIRVQVEVEYYRFTPDECIVLHEMQQCATEEDRSSGRFVEVADDDDDE